jgi:hypothetical protein
MTTIRDRDNSDLSFSCDISLEESSDCNLVMTAAGDRHEPASSNMDWSYTIGISDSNNGYDEVILLSDQLNDLVEAFQAPCLSFLSKAFCCQKRIGTSLVLQCANKLRKMAIVDADGTQIARTIVLTEQDIKMFVRAVDGSATFQRDLHAMSGYPI